jgi:hypothetical protein
MKNEEEKYRIKPRKKYARQVWLVNGKIVIVDPIESRDQMEANGEKDRHGYHKTQGEIICQIQRTGLKPFLNER